MIIPFEKGSRSAGGAGPRTRRWWSLPLIALILHGQVGLVPPAQAQVSGNTYTSPQFGYEVTWDGLWFLVNEESTPDFDALALTNGLTNCFFLGFPGLSATPEEVLAQFVYSTRTEPTVSDFESMTDGSGNPIRGGELRRAYGAYTYTRTAEDGSVYFLARYIEVRTDTPGRSIVVFACDTLAESYEVEWPQMEALLGGLRLADEPEELSEASGEPAPVFVSGPWRIAVATSALSPAHPELGLKRKTDKEWMVVILDVTNWSDEDAELSARDFTIRGSGGKTIGKIARSSMTRVADQLGLEPFADNLTMQIPAGESKRIALAFVLPKRSASPRLVHDAASLPLSTTIELTLPADLSTAPALLLEARAGEIVSASDGQTMRVLLDGRARAIRIQLLGVEPPADGECGEHAAERAIDDLAGAKILVEEDAAVTGGEDPLRYVWLVTDDGTRTLLNHSLIEDGKAMASPIPSDARFGLWLAETERAAEQANTGLWAGCPESDSSSVSERSDKPLATPVDR